MNLNRIVTCSVAELDSCSQAVFCGVRRGEG
jgi:hypothetical protein